MRQVGAFEAKNRLSELLRAAEAGEEIAITHRGRVVARLVPAEPGPNRAAVRGAVQEIRAMRRSVGPGLGTTRDLVEVGRR